MKKVLLILVLIPVCFCVKAQSGYNYSQYAFALGSSYERGYTNIRRQDNHIGYQASIIYNYSPYLQVGTELQKGTLSGGGITVDKDKYGRQYTNNFAALLVHADLQVGEAIDYSNSAFLNFAKNFYFGSGGGMVFNNNKVQRTNVIVANGSTSYVFPGKDNSVNFIIPLRFGYELKFFNQYDEPSFQIDIGYAHNIVFGEGLDGYDDPGKKFKNLSSNQYRQIFVTLKVDFGPISAYTKNIRNSIF